MKNNDTIHKTRKAIIASDDEAQEFSPEPAAAALLLFPFWLPSRAVVTVKDVADVVELHRAQQVQTSLVVEGNAVVVEVAAVGDGVVEVATVDDGVVDVDVVDDVDDEGDVVAVVVVVEDVVVEVELACVVKVDGEATGQSIDEFKFPQPIKDRALFVDVGVGTIIEINDRFPRGSVAAAASPPHCVRSTTSTSDMPSAPTTPSQPLAWILKSTVVRVVLPELESNMT